MFALQLSTKITPPLIALLVTTLVIFYAPAHAVTAVVCFVLIAVASCVTSLYTDDLREAEGVVSVFLTFLVSLAGAGIVVLSLVAKSMGIS